MEALRLLKELEEKRKRRCEVVAKEQGFSSWDEYKSQMRQRHRQLEARYEEELDEKCAKLGKTREELYLEDPQRFIPDCWEPQCNCDGKYHFLAVFHF